REPSLRERFDKFARRHPYLTSTASVCSLALAAVVAVSIGAITIRERVRTLEARSEFSAHELKLRSIQAQLDERSPPAYRLDRGLEESRQELARYAISADGPTPNWEKHVRLRYLDENQRLRVREDVGELFFLMAKAAVLKAERADGDA